MTERPSGYISVRRLNHRYPQADALALDDLTLDIARGSTFGLLGPNGAGKSTLLAILTCILTPQSGEVTIDGHRLPAGADAVKAQSALVPQEFAFYPTLTARENLEFFAGLYRLTPSQWRERLAQCVEICRLQEVLDERTERYSGGLKRRINLAIGLLAAPRILYLDEPTVGIDAVSRSYILEAIKHLKGNGSTIVYTSHYMEEVEALCDEVAVIDNGKLIAQGRMAQLLSTSGSQVLRITLAEPANGAILAASSKWQAEHPDPHHLSFTAPLTDLDAILRELTGHGARVAQLQYGVNRLHDVYLKMLAERT
jgi:ABC-2 type transport system ATP-binding protein